ncbi:MAG: EamA family transporter [Spirochaetales bacterium]|jgi:drug/metabolite transporter (DMT)-like permease|nr:EamA family transporter [Spirochaetales bacterium]
MIDLGSNTAEAVKMKGILAVFIAAVLWSTSGLVIKMIDWNPAAITGGRSFIAALVLIVVTRRLKAPKSFAGWMAAVSYACAMLTFVVANKLTTSANAIFLQYLSPAFIAFIGVFLLKEYPRKLDWIILAGVLASMTLFFIERIDSGKLAGNLIAILSGLFFAVFVIFMRLDSRGNNTDRIPLDNMIFGHLLAACLSIPFILSTPLPDTRGLLGIAYLGVIQIGLSSIFFAYGVSRMSALGTSLITLVEPIMNPVWVFLLIGETPTFLAAIGGGAIIILITVRSITAARR